MKKLMVIAAVALCAIGASATSVDWNFIEQVNKAKTYESIGDYTAYLFTASAWDSVTAKASAGKINVEDFTGYLDSKGIETITASTANTYNLGEKQTVTSSALKATDAYYIVIADTATDGSYIWASSKLTGIESYNESAEIVTPTDPASWSIGKMATSAYLTASNKAYTMAAVPEPTSAMLLLLGVAGLALKRKRA